MEVGGSVKVYWGTHESEWNFPRTMMEYSVKKKADAQ